MLQHQYPKKSSLSFFILYCRCQLRDKDSLEMIGNLRTHATAMQREDRLISIWET